MTEPLTPRQLEIVQLVADGVPAKQIAATVGINVANVYWHIRQIARVIDGDPSKDRRIVIARWWWTHAA